HDALPIYSACDQYLIKARRCVKRLGRRPGVTGTGCASVSQSRQASCQAPTSDVQAGRPTTVRKEKTLISLPPSRATRPSATQVLAMTAAENAARLLG